MESVNPLISEIDFVTYVHTCILIRSVPNTSQMLENNISEADRQFLSQWAHCGYYVVVWLTNYMDVHTNVVNCNRFYMLVVAKLAGFWFYQS